MTPFADAEQFRFLPWQTSSISVNNLSKIQVDTYRRCAALTRREDAVRPLIFSHVTALRLLGVEVPFVQKGRFNIAAFHTCSPTDSARTRRRGTKNHLWKHDNSVWSLGKLFTVSPVVAWAQMSQYVSLQELVVLGDSMMRSNSQLKKAGLGEFRNFVIQSSQFQGKRKCRQALLQMKEDTDSSQESRLRFALCARGLPDPTPHYRIADHEFSQSFLCDLAFIEDRIDVEYDGAQHEEDRQKIRDSYREQRLKKLGWRVIRVTKETLSDPKRMDALVAEILSLMASNVGG
jgi:very-short-patch-repair endonuclease